MSLLLKKIIRFPLTLVTILIVVTLVPTALSLALIIGALYPDHTQEVKVFRATYTAAAITYSLITFLVMTYVQI